MRILFLCSIIVHWAFATTETETRSSLKQEQSAPRPRRQLAPDSSIIDELNSQLDAGIKHPRFTLSALFGDSSLFADADPFEIDVVLTNPSVGKSTSYSSDGKKSYVDSSIKLLVADRSVNPHSHEFAILAVNEKTGSVSGLVQKDKQLLKLEQLGGEQSVVSAISNDTPRNWTCLVDSLHHEKGEVDNIREDNNLTVEHITHKHRLPKNNVFGTRRGRNRRQLYATDTFPNAWSYQVDLYIQVDDEFVASRDTDTTNMPNSIDYVNALVSAVSSIFEFEIDTHLNVLHIEKTSMYNGTTDATEALNLMKDTFANSTWHYTDSTTGENPDLHHFISYRSEIVGVATVGGVCDSNTGYGVSN